MTVATFVLEQHLGHHTYASNLRDSAPSDTDLTVHWVPVTYASADDHRRIPLPHALKAALAGRNEVLQGLRAVPRSTCMSSTHRSRPCSADGDHVRGHTC